MKIKPLDKQVQYISTNLPRIPFTLNICSQKGGGKTTNVINLLTNKDAFYQKFNRVILVSQTANLDDKLQYLINSPIQIPNHTLDNLLEKKMLKKKILDTDIDHIKSSYYISQNDILLNLTPDFLQELIQHQMSVIEEFKKKNADNVLLILDDSVADPFLKSKQFINFILISRHIKCSLMFLTQMYYGIHKTVRLNSSALCLYDTSNRKELEDIYNENNVGIPYKEFLNIYNQVMEIPFSFLTIIHTNKRKEKLVYCWEKIIKII